MEDDSVTKVHFKNKEGLKLVGILEKSRIKTKTCIILCHGGLVDKDEGGAFVKLSDTLVRAGFAAFRFDFRAHGESEGNTIHLTFSGEASDLEDAYRFLRKRGYNKFGIVAASLSGGAVPLFMPKHQGDVKALVLWNSTINLLRVYERWLSNGQKKLLKRNGFIERGGSKIGKKFFDEALKIKPIEKLGKLKIPMVLINGDKDTKLPCPEAARYAKMLRASFVMIHGAEHGFHGDKKYLEQACKAAVDFFKENLAS